VELLDFTLTGGTTMTEDRLLLNELLQKAGDGDFLRAVAESLLQLLMEADVEGLIGAGRHERAASPRPSNASCAGEDGVGGVAMGAGEIVSAHAVLSLRVADDRFDGGTAPPDTISTGSSPGSLPFGVSSSWRSSPTPETLPSHRQTAPEAHRSPTLRRMSRSSRSTLPIPQG
jgi:hypothetical protein